MESPEPASLVSSTPRQFPPLQSEPASLVSSTPRQFPPLQSVPSTPTTQNSYTAPLLELQMAWTCAFATLNCWAIPYPRPFGSKDRRLRLERLADQLCKEQYDVVGLQELWSEYDYLELADRIGAVYPFCHYFHSGFTGSGVAVLSRHPIVSTLTHRYSLNGFAHHIHHGDWFGGKVVGMVELEIGDIRVNFYSTHLHAEYNRMNDLYLPHRISQAFELSQFVRHTSHGADFVILTGDFNMEPGDLGYRLILSNAQLYDSWAFMHGSDNGALARGMTCDRPDNCYTPRGMLQELGDGKRLDYVLYKNGRCNGTLLFCDTTFMKIPGEDVDFSDHCGVASRFSLDQTSRQCSSDFEPYRPLLNSCISVLQGGEERARHDRKFFIGGFLMLLVLILASLYLDTLFHGFSTLFSILRFVATFIAAFCVWYGFLGLTMELKALKAAKQSMEKLLNN